MIANLELLLAQAVRQAKTGGRRGGAQDADAERLRQDNAALRQRVDMLKWVVGGCRGGGCRGYDRGLHVECVRWPELRELVVVRGWGWGAGDVTEGSRGH